MPCILIGGGSRSGKSRYALDLSRTRGSRLAFVATAQALDDEMSARIGQHRTARGPEWTTIEAPLELADAIRRHERQFDCLVIDCLTLWLSNIMLAGLDTDVQTEALAAAVRSPASLILVSNEVGCGIVPDNPLSRRFRDAAGSLNQRIAREADEVYWMAFGCGLRLK